jgi:hypothetical protein
MGGPGSGRKKGSGGKGKGIARKSNKTFLNKLKKNKERDAATSNKVPKNIPGSFRA